MSNSASLRVLFLGTPDFAVPSLRRIHESRHEVVGVISQPDRPRGRGRQWVATPIKAEATRCELPLFQPERIGDPNALAWVKERGVDIGVVIAFGQFIPKSVRDLPRERMINAHASLLPRHRGAAPIQYALLEGDPQTGVTIIRVEKEMDAGDACLYRSLEITPGESAADLSGRLSELAAETLVEALDRIASGTAVFEPQPTQGITLAPKLGKDFGRIDWNQGNTSILQRIQASTPWPASDVQLQNAGIRLRLLEVREWASETPPHARPGTVHTEDGRLGISTLDGWIEVLRLQVPGRRPVSAAEFLRGRNVSAEERVESL